MRISIKDLLPFALAAVCCIPAALFAQADIQPEKWDAPRIAACRTLADDAYAAKAIETGNLHLKDMIENCPGRWDIACPALKTILLASKDGPEDWKEYAALRLIAAYRADRLLPTDPVLRDAWGTLIAIRGYQERFLEAKAMIETLAEATGRDVWVLFLEATLCYQADSYETESRFAEILSKISANDSDPYVQAVWSAMNGHEGRNPYIESALAYRPGRLSPSTAPRNMLLKDFSSNWQAVRDLPPETVPSQIHTLIGESLDQGRFLADETTATITWLWTLIDRYLLSRKPEALLALRRFQESELREWRRGSRGQSVDSGGAITLFRRYPWTDEGQRELMEYGRQELPQGHTGVALRSFRDVLSHASDPALRAEAQVGLWLALAQHDDHGELDAAFQDVDLQERYPWMGGTETVGAIRSRLEEGLPAVAPQSSEPQLPDLTRRVVRLPAVAPWPASWQQSPEQGQYWVSDDVVTGSGPFSRVGIQFHGDGFLISSPSILAWYRADNPEVPVWQRTVRFNFSKFRRIPGIYCPALAEDRIFARWGYDRCPTDVAAFDMSTGKPTWSSALDGSWRQQAAPFRGERTMPVNDPVAADGRLYLLAFRPDDAEANPSDPSSLPLFLLCLEPNTGSRIWGTLIANEALRGRANWRPEDEVHDPAVYGNAVTAHQGAIYCAGNQGIVARCDARDGNLEWAHRYPRSRLLRKAALVSDSGEGGHAIAWGAPPLVADKRVIFMPRDYRGVFALDADTGRLLWQNAFVHPAGAIGIVEGALLVYDHRTVVSLDLATGAVRWFRHFEEGIRGRGQLIGSSLYVGTSNELCRIDANSGIVVERMPWGVEGRTIHDFVIHGRGLYIVSDEATPADDCKPGQLAGPLAAAGAGGLPFPLRHAWQLSRANAQLHVPPPEAGLKGRAYLYSDGVLECLRTDAPIGVVWQRLVQPDLGGVDFRQGLMGLKYPRRVVVLDGATGAVRDRALALERGGPGGPAPSEARARAGLIRGDRYYDALTNQGIARAIDLKSEKTLTNYSIPSWPGNRDARIVGLCLGDDSLFVLSSVPELRADAFDLKSGAHTGGQRLANVRYTKWSAPDNVGGGRMAGRGSWENEMVCGSGMLFVTDESGLHAWTSNPAGEVPPVEWPSPKLYRRRESIAVDGSTREWSQGEHVELPLDDKDKDRGSLMLAHDGSYLYLAISYRDARIDPLRGSGRYSVGDWVSIAFRDGRVRRNWKIGLVDRGRPVCLGLGWPDENPAVGIGYNIKTSQHVYEIAVPLTRGRRGVKADLSAEVWDDQGPEGPVKILECAGMTIGLHPMTRVEEETGFAIMRDLPDLPASRALYDRIRGFYEAWTGEVPPYPASKGPADPARAVEDLNRFVSEVGGGQFPYALYRVLARLGGPNALPPDVGKWFQRKRELEAGIQGPYGLNDSLAVTNWLLLGYFPAAPHDDGFDADYLQCVGGEPMHVPDRKLEVETGRGDKAMWIPYNAPDNKVNFYDMERLGLVNREVDAVIYAACWLKADADTDCELQVDTGDDWGRVYLDHEPLEEHEPSTWEPIEKSRYKVTLEEGLHLLLIKMAGSLRPSGAGHAPRFYFDVRIIDPGGARPPGITVWN